MQLQGWSPQMGQEAGQTALPQFQAGLPQIGGLAAPADQLPPLPALPELPAQLDLPELPQPLGPRRIQNSVLQQNEKVAAQSLAPAQKAMGAAQQPLMPLAALPPLDNATRPMLALPAWSAAVRPMAAAQLPAPPTSFGDIATPTAMPYAAPELGQWPAVYGEPGLSNLQFGYPAQQAH